MLERLQRAEYRNSTERASGKNARVFVFVPFFRPLLVRVMSELHKIPADLASFHVSEMDDFEVLRRFRMYAGVESSTIAAQLERATLLPQIQRPATLHGTALVFDSDSAFGLTTEFGPDHAGRGIKESGPQAPFFGAEERV